MKNISTPQQYLETPLLVCLTCNPMVIGLNLLQLDPGSVLVLNANFIPLSVKPPAADGASGKIAHIYGASIFGGYVTVQL